MIATPLTTEALVEGYDAVEQLESLSKQKVQDLLSEARRYVVSTSEVSSEEFVDQIGTEFEGYAADFLLDESIEAVTDDLDMRDVSITPEMQTMLDRLEQRLAAVLTA